MVADTETRYVLMAVVLWLLRGSSLSGSILQRIPRMKEISSLSIIASNTSGGWWWWWQRWWCQLPGSEPHRSRHTTIGTRTDTHTDRHRETQWARRKRRNGGRHCPHLLSPSTCAAAAASLALCQVCLICLAFFAGIPQQKARLPVKDFGSPNPVAKLTRLLSIWVGISCSAATAQSIQLRLVFDPPPSTTIHVCAVIKVGLVFVLCCNVAWVSRRVG